MARELDKSTRDNKAKTDDAAGSKGTAKASADSESQAGGEADKPSSQSLAAFQDQRNRELQGALAKRSTSDSDAGAIVREFAAIWLPLRATEMEVLVPAIEDAELEAEKSAAVEVRIDILNLLLADLIEEGAGGLQTSAKLDALADALNAFVAASVKQREELSQKSSFDPSTAGSQMSARYERAMRDFADLDQAMNEALDMLAPQCLSLTTARQPSRKESSMARGPEMRERDERGRFMSEDERGYSRGGGYRNERDENGRFSSGRDEPGRFGESRGGRFQDEDNGYRRQMSRGRDYDDDDLRRGGRGQGGWFGDSEGHSEASRRGWRSSEHGESGWYGDPEGHSEASRRGWRSSEHGDSGWHGDPAGHSEASRRGWERSDHPGSGWRGDPEGHSQAARRSWEEGGHEGNYRAQGRSRYDDESRRGGYESRGGSRYEDLDDYEPRGRGHGGWSGDPEGHSEASRRGWAHRR